jgi:pimeloyl-ACP methyl ester carboxylesterase
MLEDPNQRLWLTVHTARRFGTDPLDPASVGVVAVFPQFFGDNDQPDALPAIRAWTAALYGALEVQDLRISRGDLSALDLPVTVIFGALDPYLNPDLADRLSALFPKAELHLVQGASHWPQWDQPQTVSRWIR